MVDDSLNQLRKIFEAVLLASDKPLTLDQLADVFEEGQRPARSVVRQALDLIQESCVDRGFELVEVSSGYRFQVRKEFAPYAGRLDEDRPQRYSRALLETLAIIAYRQPITRGDIEEIRGVAVNTNIMRTLQEREWVRVVGYKDVPGRPAMFATTRQFLDYFNLKSLEELPVLADVRNLEDIGRELDMALDKMPATPAAEEDGEQTLH